jgi:hypothetical protein
MSILNRLLGALFNGLLLPFRGLPPWVGLGIVSLLTAVGMLYVFKRTSNQDRIAGVKDRIYACIFEIRLFNDDLRQILRSQGQILRHNLRYLGLSLVPMFWMIIPLVLVIAQLQSHYGYAGLRPGQETLVSVELRSGWPERLLAAAGSAKPDVELEVPPGLRVETPGVWIPSRGEMSWRVSAEREGDYELTVRAGDERFTKRVSVSRSIERRSPVRSASFVDQLLYPAEPALPRSGPVESISIGYDDASIGLGGWGVHWLVIFFVLSIVFGFALKDRFGVTI